MRTDDVPAAGGRAGHPESCRLEIDPSVRADVFLLGHVTGREQASWVRVLDRAGVRVIGDVEAPELDLGRALRIVGDCDGLVSVLCGAPAGRHGPSGPFGTILREADATLPHLVLVEPGLPVATSWSGEEGTLLLDGAPVLEVRGSTLHGPVELPGDTDPSTGAAEAVDAFVAAAAARRGVPAFAYLIGRLERDFAHAREAIRAAVEREAGIPCLWSGDGRHRLSVDGVRRTTQWMIERAALVIADLTLGPENPRSENPSRAHEIGLAIAFDKPLMLCSREPRRYPYFSIGDLQLFFWSDEGDLHQRATEWLRAERTRIGRTVLNHRLPDWDPDHEPTVRPSAFRFDRSRRYLWPLTKPFSGAELLAMSVSLGGIALAAALAVGLGDRGAAAYPGAGLVAVAALLGLSRWTPQLRGVLGDAARLLAPLLVVSALLMTALALLNRG